MAVENCPGEDNPPTPSPPPPPPPGPPPPPSPPPPPRGGSWTSLPVHADAKQFYASFSTGTDTNPGTEAAPFKTLARGYAAIVDGRGDRLLLKKGDVWPEGFPNWHKSGRAPSFPVVVEHYGAGTVQPRIWSMNSSGATGLHDIAVVGVDFIDNRRDWEHGDYDNAISLIAKAHYQQMRWYSSTSNLLVEGCRFMHGAAAMNIIADVRNFRVRRCVFANGYSRGSAGNEAVYISANTTQPLIEQCYFIDYNTPTAGAPFAITPTIFHHDTYLQRGNHPALVRENIHCGGLGDGGNMRSGGTWDYDLVIDRTYGNSIGDSDLRITNIIVLRGRDISEESNDARGAGIEIIRPISLEMDRCVVANKAATTLGNLYAYAIDCIKTQGWIAGETAVPPANPQLNITRVVAHNWRNAMYVTMKDGRFELRDAVLQQMIDPGIPKMFASRGLQSVTKVIDDVQVYNMAGGKIMRWNDVDRTHAEWLALSGATNTTLAGTFFTDDERDETTYHASIGRTATTAAFKAGCKAQSRANADDAYLAKTINDYIFEGFDL